ncbi:MAG: phosphatase PAP2 family protein [Capsulimonadaceae bacterium]|nr:phosphatase PAP2 family protein [Capsulimonadaceae bacterium]
MRDAAWAFVWKFLSGWVDPLLVACWLVSVWSQGRTMRSSRKVLAPAIGLAVSLTVVYIVRGLHVWPAHPLFPSGHEAIAASIATSLALLDRRWMIISAGLAALLALSLVLSGYHSWVDVIGSLLLCPVLTYACHVRLP